MGTDRLPRNSGVRIRLAAHRFRRVRTRLWGRRLCLERSRAMRRRPARGTGQAGPGSDRSHGRPERTSAATESDLRAGQKFGGNPRTRNAGCQSDRPQHCPWQDSRVDLRPSRIEAIEHAVRRAGTELVTADEARSQALRSARELWADAVQSGRDLGADAVVIADEQGSLTFVPMAAPLPV